MPTVGVLHLIVDRTCFCGVSGLHHQCFRSRASEGPALRSRSSPPGRSAITTRYEKHPTIEIGFRMTAQPGQQDCVGYWEGERATTAAEREAPPWCPGLRNMCRAGCQTASFTRGRPHPAPQPQRNDPRGLPRPCEVPLEVFPHINYCRLRGFES